MADIIIAPNHDIDGTLGEFSRLALEAIAQSKQKPGRWVGLESYQTEVMFDGSTIIISDFEGDDKRFSGLDAPIATRLADDWLNELEA